MKNQIEANNELIAEFMKVNVITLDDIRSNKNPFISSANGYLVEDLKYHKDWNELHKVIDKIEDIRFDNEDTNSFVSYHRYDVDNRGICCTITDQQEGAVVGHGDRGTKLESTYEAVVEFMRIYNPLKNLY